METETLTLPAVVKKREMKRPESFVKTAVTSVLV